ncbi:MAG: hypothetical protein K6C06_09995 [Lachnospiraceae bacterium]|nr:hypothetical protein [Lachnospiraceae bacterium]
MDGLSGFLLYIPGILIFLVGSGQVRQWLGLHSGGMTFQGTVVSCKHVIKKDKKDREIYNYYDVLVELKNPKTGNTEKQSLKAPSEYSVGQQITVNRTGNQYMIAEQKTEFVFTPWQMMIGGALLILLALFQNQGKEVPAMICLSLVLAGAGAAIIADYLSIRNKHLVTIDAEIREVYGRQISRGTKIVKGDKFTYYPVVRYELDGKENLRRCTVNSSQENSFKVGSHLNLYYDPVAKTISERKERTGMLVLGIILLAIGLLALASTASVAL